MRTLFMMLCVLSLTIGSCFAMGEDMTNADGSYCEEGGKSPDSLAKQLEVKDESRVVQE